MGFGTVDPVIIAFATQGLTDVNRAFDTIGARVKAFEKSSTDESVRASRVRRKVVEDEVGTVTRIRAKAKTDEEQRSRYLDAVRTRSSTMAGKLAESLAKEEERAGKQAARELERLEEQKLRVRIRSSEMAGRLAARQAAEEVRAAEQSARARGAAGRRIGGIAAGSVGRLAGGVASIAGATLGIGGGFLLANVARQEADASRTAALLVNAVTTGGAPPAGANVGAIMGAASQQSRALGMDKGEILRGALEYSRKARGGDFAGVMANMGFFAKMSQVTGADIGDIAGAAGTLQSQNKNLSAPQMQQMLLDVYAQGKAGSLSMVDVSKQLGVMASARGAFSGDVAVNQRKLLALGQLAAPEGSPEEAGTFIKDLVMEAGKHGKELRGMGVKFDRFGRMDSPEQMIDQVFRGTGGDITKIEKLFGARGKSLFGALLNPFTSAGGGEAGIAAVNKTMASVTGATMTTGQLESQHAQMMSTPAEKFAVALNRLKEVLAERLTPWMERFADKLPVLVPKIEAIIDEAGKFATWFADNPIKGVGAVVLAAITKDLAAAGIGQAVKSILASLLGGGHIPVPGVAGFGLGGALGVAAAGAGGAMLEGAIIDSDIAGRESGQRAGALTGVQGVLGAAALNRKTLSGKVTAGDIAEAQNRLKSMSSDVESKRQAIGSNDMGFAQTAAMQLVDPSGAKQHAQDVYNEQVRSFKMAKDAMDAFARAVTAATVATTHKDNPARNLPINQRPTP